jgi:hypothetical protein
MIRPSALAHRPMFTSLGRFCVLIAVVLFGSRSACALDATFNPLATAGTSAATAAWSPVADYQTDFQSGAPASGWKYTWNPTGKLGNSNGFSPLKWSTAAQAYNTIGDVVITGKKKKKKKASASNSLVLQASGGHPGKSNFLPIVGYTIQPEDGAGLYRLMNSSIAKTDGIQSKKEDGLGVFVYMNNTSMGPTQLVSTNGLISSFDRDLGQLNVGDTIWVMVNPLKNPKFDAFHRFDFTVEKFAAITEPGGSSSEDPGPNIGTFPEPGTAVLVLTALGGLQFTRRRRT